MVTYARILLIYVANTAIEVSHVATIQSNHYANLLGIIFGQQSTVLCGHYAKLVGMIQVMHGM